MKKATKLQLCDIKEAELFNQFCEEARFIPIGKKYHIRVGQKDLKHKDTHELFKMFKREVKQRKT